MCFKKDLTLWASDMLLSNHFKVIYPCSSYIDIIEIPVNHGRLKYFKVYCIVSFLTVSILHNHKTTFS